MVYDGGRLANWRRAQLERQLGTLYYERLLGSKDAQRAAEAAQARRVDPSPREFVRDPVLLEFLGLPETGRLMNRTWKAPCWSICNLPAGAGQGLRICRPPAAPQHGKQDFYIDLVFYNYLLKCFVLFDLKAGELTHQDIGQMDMYVRLYDDQKRGSGQSDRGHLVVRARITRWFVTRSCTKASNCSPASIVWYYRLKKNFAGKLSGSMPTSTNGGLLEKRGESAEG